MKPKRVGNLRLEILEPIHHGKKLRVKISNVGGSNATKCYGRITIEHTADDVVEISAVPTFIGKNDYTQVKDMNLCWSYGGGTEERNIPKGVYESLDVCSLEDKPVFMGHGNDYKHFVVFEIPSEQGYAETRLLTSGVTETVRKSRVMLDATRKNYSGELTVAGENAELVRKKFTLSYDKKANTPLIELTSS